eukprot:3941504-Rhodomonas_salina.1
MCRLGLPVCACNACNAMHGTDVAYGETPLSAYALATRCPLGWNVRKAAAPKVSAYARARPCPILTYRMMLWSLRAWYAMCGTDVPYNATRMHAC